MISIKKRLASAVPAPAADKVTLFIDDAGVPKTKDSAGTVTDVGGGGGATILQQAAEPTAPASGDLWIDTDETAAASSSASVPGYYPDAPPTSPHANNDEFNDGALGAAWTEWDHGASIVVTEGDGGLKLKFSPMPGAWTWGGVYRTIPTGDWSIVTKFHPFFTPIGAGWAHAALVVYEDATSAAGDFYNFGFEMSNGSGQYIVQRFSQWNTHLANVTGTPPLQPVFPYLRLTRVGTTYNYDFGDGVTWLRLHSTTIAITPAHIGLAIGASGNVHGPDLGSHFRFWRQSASTAIDTPVLGRVVT